MCSVFANGVQPSRGLWAKEIGNLWRTTGDIIDKWDNPDKKNGNGVVRILDLQTGIEDAAGPGHWNDPDMLEVGNGGMTLTEYRSHFSLWCLMAAPLMAGNDIRSMSADIQGILTNKEAIAINQDPLGVQGRSVEADVWAKQLADGGRAVALLNRSSGEKRITVNWTSLGYPGHLTAQVRDLWAHKDVGPAQGSFSATVPSHGVVMITVKP